MQLLTAVAALVVGIIVARIVLGFFKRSMRKTKLSDILVEFLARFLSALLYVLVILLTLAAVGVDVGSIFVSLAAMAGLIMGFGMSGTVNNIASGTWIAALRPIDIGEVVTINGKTGKVNAVGIGYGSSVDKAVQVAMGIMKAHPLVLDEPEPAVVITELADSSVNLALRPWTNTENYWAVKGDVSKAVLEGLPAAGVEIPFPQLDVHLSKE
jgi:small-conductance mechanosensitive channel